jgi:Flp pilus assembly protein TadB
LAFAPEYYRSPFRLLSVRSEGPMRGFKKQLAAAGLFDEAPTFLIVTGLLAAAALGLVFGVLLGSPAAILLGPVLVFIVGYAYLQKKARGLLKATTDSLIPFIRRVEGSVRVGVPAPAAYREAVAESPAGLKRILQDSVAQMATGTPFIEAIRGTQERLPLRMWSVFVRQIEIHDEAGGDLSKGLSATVRHIDTMVDLQKQGQAHYAGFATQQRIAFGLGGFAIFFMATRLDRQMLLAVLKPGIGWLFLAAGVGFIAAGVFVSRHSLKAISKRIDF